MRKLYRFYWDCGRNGSVEGIFIAEEEDVKNAIGENVYFGEILGKHSEVYGILEESDIKELNVSSITVKELEKIAGTNICGYNPLDYLDLDYYEE